MLSVSWFRVFSVVAVVSAGGFAVLAMGQEPQHGRKYKPLPPTAHVVVTVEKGFNSKPLPNAAVVFHATRDGQDDGNLEVKTDPDGHAAIDVLEVGSHVTVQVIASGFATYSSDFDLTGTSKDILVKLERPKAQISVYEDNDGKAAQVKPGTQERVVPKAAPAPASPAQPPVASSAAPSGSSTPPQ